MSKTAIPFKKAAGILTLSFAAASLGACKAPLESTMFNPQKFAGIYACTDRAGDHVRFDTADATLHGVLFGRWIEATDLDTGKKLHIGEKKGWHCHRTGPGAHHYRAWRHQF